MQESVPMPENSQHNPHGDSENQHQIESYRLGENNELLVCQGVEEHQSIILAIMQQTEWHIDIFTRHFDPRIYGTEEFGEAIEQLALNNYRCRIRILLQDSKLTATRGHRVLEIGRRLSSYFQFRQVDERHRKLPYSFLIADQIAYLYQPHADALKSEVNFCDAARARQLIEQFETLWMDAESSPWLRHHVL
jgi:hypothetical protein